MSTANHGNFSATFYVGCGKISLKETYLMVCF